MKKVRVDGDVLTVETKPLRCLASGVEFGRFTIEVSLSKGLILSVENETPIEDDWGEVWHHPHVDDDLYPCWGNAEQIMDAIQGGHDVVALVALTIDFLQSYRPLSRNEQNPIYRLFRERSKQRKT